MPTDGVTTLRVPTDDGAELHVECAGDPDAPVTVVFAHGWALARLSWADQFEALRAEARVVRYDQRHHGLSTGAPDASGPDGAGAPDGAGGISIPALLAHDQAGGAGPAGRAAGDGPDRVVGRPDAGAARPRDESDSNSQKPVTINSASITAAWGGVMTEVAQLPTVPAPRTCPFDPPAELSRLRDERPVTRAVLPTGQVVWVITAHELVRRLLTDPRVSSRRSAPGFPLPVKVAPEVMRRQGFFGEALIGIDPPQHTERRRMVISEFSVRRVQAMRPRIQQIVDERIDAMLAGPRPTDLVQALALPVPSMVICELLGVPYQDRDFFQSRTQVLVRRSTPPQERAAAGDELSGYLDRLVSAKEAEPTEDDLLGRLILRNRETGVFTHDLLAGMGTLLLLAGHETTANMISMGTVTLLENPEQLAALRADPAVTPLAVEELLRYLTIVEAGFRLATADIEIGGEVIRAGEGVVALAGTANRDVAAFDDPDRFDVRRGARHHVSFGYGIHQCLGQNLARLELEIVFDTLFRRVPGLRLAAPLGELPFKDDTQIYGVYRLPVTW
jgi:cytochrome P450